MHDHRGLAADRRPVRPARLRIGQRTAVALGLVIAATVGGTAYVLWNGYYVGRSPTVRVTVASGCPLTLGKAADVRNAGQHWWDKAFGDRRLASEGATSGLVCRYGGAARSVRAQLRLDASQATELARLAHRQRGARWRGGITPPPGEAGEVILVVFGYSDRPDLDIWYARTGHQAADNGQTQVFFYGPGTLPDDFPAQAQAYVRALA